RRAVLAGCDDEDRLAVRVRELGHELARPGRLRVRRRLIVAVGGLRGAECPEQDDHDEKDQAERDPCAAARGQAFGEWSASAEGCHVANFIRRGAPGLREEY